MTAQPPAADFLMAFCSELGVNGDWLLTGRGPMKASDVKYHALSEARAADLLGAMAGSVETLIDRVDRMEKYVQTLETPWLRVEVVASAGDADLRETLGARLKDLGGTVRELRREAPSLEAMFVRLTAGEIGSNQEPVAASSPAPRVPTPVEVAV